MGVNAEIAFGPRESVIQKKGFSPVTSSKEVLFVTSNSRFRAQLTAGDGSDAQTLDFERSGSYFHRRFHRYNHGMTTWLGMLRNTPSQGA
jgi:hypothetical protein